MTKIKHFEIPNPVKPNLKPIELVKYISISGELVDNAIDTLEVTNDFDNIMLIVDSHTNGTSFDIIYLYDDNYPQSGRMFLGHWNDGVIE